MDVGVLEHRRIGIKSIYFDPSNSFFMTHPGVQTMNANSTRHAGGCPLSIDLADFAHDQQ